jgi:hypothetical protein
MRDNQRSDLKQLYYTCTLALSQLKSRQVLLIETGRSCCDDGKKQASLTFLGTEELDSCCARQDSQLNRDGSSLKIF